MGALLVRWMLEEIDQCMLWSTHAACRTMSKSEKLNVLQLVSVTFGLCAVSRQRRNAQRNSDQIDENNCTRNIFTCESGDEKIDGNLRGRL